LISILAVNPDLLNIASISFIIFFTEGHLKIDAASFHLVSYLVEMASSVWQIHFFPIYVLYNLYYGDISTGILWPY
jgi:hypothetical protein